MAAQVIPNHLERVRILHLPPWMAWTNGGIQQAVTLRSLRDNGGFDSHAIHHFFLYTLAPAC